MISDYDIYEKQISNDNPTCNKDYNEYLKKYVDTYNEFEGKCKNGQNSSDYCKAFNKYFDKKDPVNLSNWKCNLQNSEPKEEKASGDTEEIKEQVLPAHGWREESVTLTEGSEGGRKQVEERHS
ncbi:hypothetical protein PVIIG_05733 [Plasmodium vivax India VII]|uniref:Uncharacterized protein n=1 Tax=Plasmodium vivax India VII TaxID=1077284 RepID=A0A0J9S4L7_PLAVI|nr:hypothetical protein PVIIG_05733 [Plasmodium vivax India VII]